VGTGLREENASKQEQDPAFRFNRNAGFDLETTDLVK